jgi:hypothetical protein
LQQLELVTPACSQLPVQAYDQKLEAENLVFALASSNTVAYFDNGSKVN